MLPPSFFVDTVRLKAAFNGNVYCTNNAKNKTAKRFKNCVICVDWPIFAPAGFSKLVRCTLLVRLGGILTILPQRAFALLRLVSLGALPQ